MCFGMFYGISPSDTTIFSSWIKKHPPGSFFETALYLYLRKHLMSFFAITRGKDEIMISRKHFHATLSEFFIAEKS